MNKPLTKKQDALVRHLREHGPTTVRDLAASLGSTGRGIGVMHSALMWSDFPINRHQAATLDYMDDVLSVEPVQPRASGGDHG